MNGFGGPLPLFFRFVVAARESGPAFVNPCEQTLSTRIAAARFVAIHTDVEYDDIAPLVVAVSAGPSAARWRCKRKF
jgi:hypothetical protein